MSDLYERGEATRDKKEQRLKDGDRVRGHEIKTLIAEEMNRHGLNWLTDDQIDDLVSRSVSKERFANRLRVQNRRLFAAQKKSENAA